MLPPQGAWVIEAIILLAKMRGAKVLPPHGARTIETRREPKTKRITQHLRVLSVYNKVVGVSRIAIRLNSYIC